MPFAVIEKASYWEDDSYGSGGNVWYDKYVEIENKEALIAYLKRDAARSSPLVKKVLKVEELTYTTEIVINGL